MIAGRDIALAAQLVDANLILADQGVVDAYGHVSVRSLEHPDRFLISRNRAPALVTGDDILSVGLDGDVPDGHSTYLERFIHSEIYGARPDVGAIVHSHAPSIIPFTVSREELRPIMHVAGFLGLGVTRFDIADFRGDGSNLLVTDAELGAALATELGRSPVVLMRGHGFVTVADTLPVAVAQAVYARVNASTLLESLRLGPPQYLTTAEAEATRSAVGSQIDRAWDVWRREARRRYADLDPSAR